MSDIVEEIRQAWDRVGIRLDQPATYGTYYRLRCAGCDGMVGTVGDRLLPGMAAGLVAAQLELYAAGLLGCACGHQRERTKALAREDAAPWETGPAPGQPGRGSGSGSSTTSDLWPLWRRLYAEGDPLPRFTPPADRPPHRFDEGDPLPDEYKSLLLKMLRHEGERAGNKSFLGFMATCLDVAETLFPTREMKLLKAEYLAEELKHAIMFHRLAVGLEPEFALRDVPYAHYAFHLPRETWADDAYFHFFVDLNGAFHARDWRESSYVPLAKMSAVVERDELGHSEMGYYFLEAICDTARGRALAQELLAKWYPAALDMFGRSDSANAPKFIRWGLKSVGNAEIRQAYKQYVDRKLTALGLDLPDERRNRRFL
jgi:1,2-phenylacetyl-CoA epoxidase catalytic subunit